jgi:CHAT domain-containing protein
VRRDIDLAPARLNFTRALRGLNRRSPARESAIEIHADALRLLGAGRLDDAIDALTKATAIAPAGAERWSDLAAAYLERGLRDGTPHDYVAALAAAERVAKQSPGFAAALFNRALALERLFLREEAISAWWSCLRRDRSSPWAGEVEQHLEALEMPQAADDRHNQGERLAEAASKDARSLRQAVARFPQAAREEVEEDLLPAWGRSVLAQEAKTAERLYSQASSIAAMLATVEGERMDLDAILAIGLARESVDGGATLRRLASGHVKLAEGLEYFQRNEFDRAASRFEQAGSALREGGSPFAEWATLHRARCNYQKAQYQGVLSALAPLAEDAQRRGHAAVAGRAFRLMGLIHIISGEPVEALAASARGRALFARLGEQANLAGIDALSAEGYEFLGERDQQWKSLFRALHENHEAGTLTPSNDALEDAALAASQEGELGAALYFQNQFVHEVRRTGNALWLAEARCGRAALYSAAGKPQLALEDIARARAEVAQVPDLRSRQSALADVGLAEGRIRRTLDPTRAIAPLQQALAVYRESGYRGAWPQVALELALADLALHHDIRAERGLKLAAAERERQREQIQGEQERASYFAQMREVTDDLVLFESEQRHRDDVAFDYAERSRGRMLLDYTLSPSPTGTAAAAAAAGLARPLTARQVARGLPHGTVLLEFALAKGRLLTWSFHAGGSPRLFTARLDANELIRWEKELAVARRAGKGWERPSSALYEHLLGPVAGEIAPDSALVLVLDGPLAAIPFAALRDPQTGRFLVEDHPLSVAPSASLYLASLRRDRSFSRNVQTVLAVGDPAFSRELFPLLPSLPESLAEAETVARLFPLGRTLLGEKATKAAFLEAASSSSLVHFGGHSVLDLEHPLSSHLVLATDKRRSDDGVLYARDLFRQRFAATRLVVLASCNSAGGRIARGEEVSGLAGAFVAAGVPAIVGTLWQVEDAASRAFFARFYRRLRSGADAVTALRTAQVEMLQDANPAFHAAQSWAGFELVGGVRLRGRVPDKGAPWQAR